VVREREREGGAFIFHIGILPRLIVRIVRSYPNPLFTWREGVVFGEPNCYGLVRVEKMAQNSVIVMRTFGSDEQSCVRLFRFLDGAIQSLLQFYGTAAVSTCSLCPSCLSLTPPTAAFEFNFLVAQCEAMLCFSCNKKIPNKAVIPDLLLQDCQKRRVAESDVVFEGQIARGGFGVIYRATLNAEVVAVKQLNLSLPCTPKNAEDPTFQFLSQQFRDLSHEAYIMAKCDHPNIVRLLGFSFTSESSFLVMEMLSMGSLFDLIHTKQPTPLADNWLLSFLLARDIANGMYHLHFQHAPAIIHGDLKSPNVLLHALPRLLTEHNFAFWQELYAAMQSPQPPAERQALWNEFCALVTTVSTATPPLAKIADFGTSDSIFLDELTREAMVDNPIWLAPEQTDSTWADVWSFAMIMYELLALSIPFSHVQFKFSFQLGDAIKAGLRPDLTKLLPTVPSWLTELMSRCWTLSPTGRPTFEVICTALNQVTLEELFTPTAAAAATLTTTTTTTTLGHDHDVVAADTPSTDVEPVVTAS
jgi:serine/threonine protein kinase